MYKVENFEGYELQKLLTMRKSGWSGEGKRKKLNGAQMGEWRKVI